MQATLLQLHASSHIAGHFFQRHDRSQNSQIPSRVDTPKIHEMQKAFQSAAGAFSIKLIKHRNVGAFEDIAPS